MCCPDLYWIWEEFFKMTGLPAIKLIPISSQKASPPPPTDLRSRSITEFFQSQSLAPKTRLA
jgi:hypothetical protein